MKKIILIIEDDSVLAEGLEILLKDEGYEVFTESDGRGILKKFSGYTPDLLLVDYRLPYTDGGVIIRKLKSQKDTKNIPMILMSASQHNMQSIAKDVGANAFFVKPFSIDDLMKTIHVLLQKT